MQQHGSKYFACTPDPGVRLKRSNLNFAEMVGHGCHVLCVEVLNPVNFVNILIF